MKKYKLLFIVEAMGGGVFTYIVDLANELVRFYDMYIAYAVRPQTPVDYREQFDKQIHLIKVKNFTRNVDFKKDLKAFFEIRKIAKEISPDIIHLHSSKAGTLGRWAFSGRKTALFYTPHGYSFLMADCGWKKRLLFKMIEIVSAKRNCTVISCSEGEHMETLKLTKKAAYVNNGINIAKLQQLIYNSVPVKKKKFTVFTLGRICAQKNPVLFNWIAEALPEVQFIWIGDGELRHELKSSNIKITGWVKREKALQYSLEADVFLLVSLWEGLPMSLLEAMYMKKVCVVSDVVGNHDVIHTNQNGYVCHKPSDFVKAIREVMKNGQDILAERAYEDVIREYNTTIMAEKYYKIYRKGFAEIK